jgi:HaeIII restriction endonuclease
LVKKVSTSQVDNGKAFEYTVAQALSEALEVPIIESSEFQNTKNCFDKVSPKLQNRFPIASTLAIQHIVEKESKNIAKNEPKGIWIASDSNGQKGDVRDVVVQSDDSELGISCKTNHDDFKHSRLSGTANFVQKWGLDPLGCSDEYWAAVRPLFAELKNIRNNSGAKALWSDQVDVPNRFYWKVLDAFEAELLRLTAPDAPRSAEVTKSLISYIIGNHDFYKVISRPDQVEIQGFNLNGSLAVSKTHYPEHVIGIDRLNGGQYSKTVRFNRGFTFNFRIHSASSRVEPSLKFAVSAISLPPTEIYTHHIGF